VFKFFLKFNVFVLNLVTIFSFIINNSVYAVTTKGKGKGILGEEKEFNIAYLPTTKKYILRDTVRNIETRSDNFKTIEEQLEDIEFDAKLRWDPNYSEIIKDSVEKSIVNSATPYFEDSIAVDAHTNMAIVYDYYKNMFGRDSYDNKGSEIIQYVHYGKQCKEGLFNGMAFRFGDGDGKDIKPRASLLAVVGHEFTHAVIFCTAYLSNEGMPGALHESLCDCMGALISKKWVIGDDNELIRSLFDPTINGHPDHMSKYIENGNTHVNCGIHNKAIFLLSEGGNHYGVTVKGIGREKTAKIIYHAITKYLKENSTFHDMREPAISSAKDLNFTEEEIKSIEDAYTAVGIY